MASMDRNLDRSMGHWMDLYEVDIFAWEPEEADSLTGNDYTLHYTT